jgi:hypothetical protein
MIVNEDAITKVLDDVVEPLRNKVTTISVVWGLSITSSLVKKKHDELGPWRANGSTATFDRCRKASRSILVGVTFTFIKLSHRFFNDVIILFEKR